ncbi:MAG: D-aminoacylase [SAR324 cluster bacterium]|nr:D-aminoacylase [SAR324 cluster bacterium]
MMDLIIRNALLVDGSGKPAKEGDLGIKDDRIAGMGDLSQERGSKELNAGGKVLSPGFIDSHTHDDRAVLHDPLMSCKISQGVTTVITGNCGVSLAPLKYEQRPPPPLDLVCEDPKLFFSEFSGYLKTLDQEPPSLNVAAQVGHSTLRLGTMDRLDREATPDEIKTMRSRLESSLLDGAIGFSTGLFYPPAGSSSTEEVIEIAKSLKQHHGIHSTHMRDEGDRIMDSLDETLKIGTQAQTPVIISHHKCAGIQNFGRSTETLKKIEEMRQKHPIGIDVYPYVAGSTMLASGRAMNAQKILVTWSRPHPEAAGKELDEVAKDMNLDRESAIEKLSPAGGIFFMMDENDVRRILSYPHSIIGSDGLPHDDHPHPRLWGTFPRVLGHYVREIGLFSLEEGINKMTHKTALAFGLKDRGILRPGAYADLVLFDPETILDRATFDNPKEPASGIEWVMVNGRMVWNHQTHSGQRPGKVLRLQELDPPLMN